MMDDGLEEEMRVNDWEEQREMVMITRRRKIPEVHQSIHPSFYT